MEEERSPEKECKRGGGNEGRRREEGEWEATGGEARLEVGEAMWEREEEAAAMAND